MPRGSNTRERKLSRQKKHLNFDLCVPWPKVGRNVSKYINELSRLGYAGWRFQLALETPEDFSNSKKSLEDFIDASLKDRIHDLSCIELEEGEMADRNSKLLGYCRRSGLEHRFNTV